MKKILAFEADPALAQDLQREFAAYGCVMEVVEDGNQGLQRARTERPDLILLSIELPKMNGFSICNKLKKNPELKHIPLVIMSSEATEETFQQHRKLRTHAEDYIRKPFQFDALLSKVTALVDLSASEGGPYRTAAPPSVQASDDAVMEGGDIDVELVEEEGGPFGAVDAEVEQFTDTAFANLESGAEAPGATPALTGFDDGHSEDKTVLGEAPPFLYADQAGGGAPHAEARPHASPTPLPEPDLVPIEDLAEDDATVEPLGPSEEEERLRVEVEELRRANKTLVASEAQLRGQLEDARRSQGATSDTEAQLRGDLEGLRSGKNAAEEQAKSLQRDKEMLEKQIQQLRHQIERAETEPKREGGVSSREFLDLRELLNKKDRELLDLKDSINAKEKGLLDQRERITALEREIADRSDRITEVERNLGDANEQLRALKDDKEMLGKKVAGLEKRIEAASTETERLRRELTEEKDRREAEGRHAEERRKKELAEQKDKLESEAAAELESALSAQRGELTAQREGEVAELSERHRQELDRAEERREKDLTDQRLRYEEEGRKADERLRGEHAAAIADLEAAHTAESEEAERRHAELVQGLRDEHSAEIEKLKGDHAAEIERMGVAHEREMGVLGVKLAKTETELTKVRDDLAERDSTIVGLREDVSDRDSRIGQLEAEGGRLKEELADAKERGERLDAEVASLRRRLDEVEAWNAHNQERALRALQKVRTDGEVVDKCKRALAIALTLLDDLPQHEDIGPPPGSPEGTIRS